jgi:hypothetical protein
MKGEIIMASRKDLKKTINNIASELFTECMILKETVDADNQEAVNTLITKVLHLQNEHICRVSHTEPGNVGGFYKKLYADFDKEVGEILDGMKALCKE